MNILTVVLSNIIGVWIATYVILAITGMISESKWIKAIDLLIGSQIGNWENLDYTWEVLAEISWKGDNNSDRETAHALKLVNTPWTAEYEKWQNTMSKAEKPFKIVWLFLRIWIIFLCSMMILFIVSVDYLIMTINIQPFIELKSYITKQL
jgi:hypothetical protein